MSLPEACIPRILTDVTSLPANENAARIALLRSKKWPNGSQLKVAFQGASTAQRNAVRAVCDELQQYVNIDFTFGVPAEIRITFASNLGAWSYLGTDALQQPMDKATMNLGFSQGGTYLHEFLHGIGAVHEHQRVDPSVWNKEAVYRDLGGPPNNWDRATIDANMFQTFAVAQLNGSQFDPRSIMLYSIPRAWLRQPWEGYHSGQNATLSPQDIAWLKTQYPGRGEPDPPPNPPTGEIHVPVFDLTPTGETISSPGERDLFAFKVERAGMYRVETTGPTSVVLRLLGPNSPTKLIEEKNDMLLPDNVRIDQPLNPGQYYAQVSHADPSGTGPYSIRVLGLTPGDTFGGERGTAVITMECPVLPGNYETMRR